MSAYERNLDKLRVMQQLYERLIAIPDAERTIERSKELLKLADQIEKLEAKVNKQKKEASVSREEADANAQNAGEAMAAFLSDFDIYFTAGTGFWWYHEHGEWVACKPSAFFEKFHGVIYVDDDSYKMFQNAMDAADRKITGAHYAWDVKPGYLNLLSVGQFLSADRDQHVP